MARWKREELRHGRDDGDEFLVLHGGSRAPDLGSYCSELSQLARDGWLHYVPTVSRPWEDDGWTGETGRVEDTIRKHADNYGYHAEGSVAYLCGNPDMIEYAKNKLRQKRADLIVANDVSREDSGFDVDSNAVTFVTGGGAEELPLQPKSAVAAQILDRVERLLQAVPAKA